MLPVLFFTEKNLITLSDLYLCSFYYLHSGLKISVRVLSLAFQSGLVGENSD